MMQQRGEPGCTENNTDRYNRNIRSNDYGDDCLHCHIPYGANGGYIHFGDTMIYLAAVFLPRPYALAAAAIGGGIADLLTAPMWMPATVIIKMLIVLPFSEKNNRLLSTRNIMAPILSGVVSAAGYYAAEGIFSAPLHAGGVSCRKPDPVGRKHGLFYIAAIILERSHVNIQSGV